MKRLIAWLRELFAPRSPVQRHPNRLWHRTPDCDRLTDLDEALHGIHPDTPWPRR